MFGLFKNQAPVEAAPCPPRPAEEYMVRCVSGWLWQTFKLKKFTADGKPKWFYDCIVPASETCPSREAAEFWITYDLSGKDPTLHDNRGGWPPFSLFHAYYDADGSLLSEEPAQAIEAQRAATGNTDAVEDESAVGNAGAPETKAVNPYALGGGK